jgi:3-deoxy-7-phosphoheptulonate synthase
MIIVTKPDATEEQIEHIVNRIKEWGLRPEVSRGSARVVIGVVGPEDVIREKPLAAIPGVESVTPVLKPYKLVAHEFRQTASLVDIGGVTIGGPQVVVISGPCSVESRDQLIAIAADVKKAGARVLRGGAFKPRTSPYSFQGLGIDGLKLLAEAREATGLPVITEIMDTKDLDVIEKYADCLQVGARNMQNFALLKEVGRSKLPVMLKRGSARAISTSCSASAASAPSRPTHGTRSISTPSRSSSGRPIFPSSSIRPTASACASMSRRWRSPRSPPAPMPS